MPTQKNLTQDDALEDFFKMTLALNGIEKDVYLAGSGPAVVVMTEMPGISPHVRRHTRFFTTQLKVA